MYFSDKSKRIISFVLVFCMVLSVAMIPPKQVKAANKLTGCLITALAGIISSLGGQEVPTKDYGQNLKDQCIDAVFYVLNEIVIKKITTDMITWINTGFDGNPAFLENYDQFMRDVADEEIGTFIDSTELGFLCSPFQAEIKIALTRANSRGKNSDFNRGITCKLSDVSENVENFLGGDFADGGWDAWTTLSYDNPYSQYLKVSLELEGRKLGALEAKDKEISIGRGFLSYAEKDKECIEKAKKDVADKNLYGGGGATDQGPFVPLQNKEEEDKLIANRCPDIIQTPGSVIEQQLNTVLPAGFQRLQAADEINEMVDAVLSYYINKAVTNGLKSLSKKTSSGKSYNDNVNKNPVPPGNSGGSGNSGQSGGSSGGGNPQFNPNDFGLPDYDPRTSTTTP